MPKATVSKQRVSATDRGSSGADRSVKRTAKTPKPSLSAEERLLKLRQSLVDSIEADVPANALKTVSKILRLTPDDELAQTTRIQLLIALERYRDALAVMGGEPLPEHVPAVPAAKRVKVRADDPAPAGDVAARPIETAYCLYKLNKLEEAQRVGEDLKSTAMDGELDRALLLLEAQILYKREDYEASRAAYEQLLVTVEPDTPEQADIETNIAACTVHLDFFASIPTRLAEARPDIASLEATPLSLVVPQPARRTPAEPPKEVAGKQKKTEKAKRPPKLPAHIAAMLAEERPAPDPERWLPKRERSGYVEPPRKRDRKKERAVAAAATQGASTTSAPAKASAKKGKGKKR